MADSDIWNRLCAFADKEKNNALRNLRMSRFVEVILAIGRLLKSHIILRDYHSRS